MILFLVYIIFFFFKTVKMWKTLLVKLKVLGLCDHV